MVTRVYHIGLIQKLASCLLEQNAIDQGVVVGWSLKKDVETQVQQALSVLCGAGIHVFFMDTAVSPACLRYSMDQSKSKLGLYFFAKETDGVCQVRIYQDPMLFTDEEKEAAFLQENILGEKEVDTMYLHETGNAFWKLYAEHLKRQCIRPEYLRRKGKKIRVVCAVLSEHGKRMCDLFADIGLGSVFLYDKNNNHGQSLWDFAGEKQADLIVTLDPLWEFVQVYERLENGAGYHSITASEIGSLMTEYLISERLDTESGMLLKSPYVSRLLTEQGQFYYREVREMLWEAGEIPLSGSMNLPVLLGIDERGGYFTSKHGAFFDAALSVLYICETYAFYNQKKQSLRDGMQDLYRKYGCYRDDLITLPEHARSHTRTADEELRAFVANPPKTLGRHLIVSVRDYMLGVEHNLITGRDTSLMQKGFLVVGYELSDHGWCYFSRMRENAGDDTTLLVYFGTKESTMLDVDEKLSAIRADIINDKGIL